MNIIKKDKFIRIINIIIVIIFILHILISFIEIVDHNNLVPTGNVDIFDINCDCQNNCDKENGSLPVFGDENDLLVYDDNGYFGKGNLRIFENPAYEYESIIAPGSSNTYQFIVRNNNNFDINVNFNISEINEYKIKLKFRLKENNKYIIGDADNWVTIDKLSYSNINISSHDYKRYSLDWKWEYSDNSAQDKIDTNIAFDAKENYHLIINIKATRDGD